MAEFKVIETQEDFDARIKDRIERAEKKARDEFKEWMSPENIQKLKDDYAKEIESLKSSHAKELEKYSGYDAKFDEFTGKIHDLETRQLKTRIANEKKLPYDAIEFLTGDDEESISASADKLSKLSVHRQTGFVRNTEEPVGDSKEQAYRELARNLTKE